MLMEGLGTTAQSFRNTIWGKSCDSERKQLGPADGDTQSHTGRGLFTTMVLSNPGAALIIGVCRHSIATGGRRLMAGRCIAGGHDRLVRREPSQ